MYYIHMYKRDWGYTHTVYGLDMIVQLICTADLHTTSQYETNAELDNVQAKHLRTEAGNDHIPPLQRSVHILSPERLKLALLDDTKHTRQL